MNRNQNIQEGEDRYLRAFSIVLNSRALWNEADPSCWGAGPE